MVFKAVPPKQSNGNERRQGSFPGNTAYHLLSFLWAPGTVSIKEETITRRGYSA